MCKSKYLHKCLKIMRDDRVCKLEYKELRTTMFAMVKVVKLYQMYKVINFIR